MKRDIWTVPVTVTAPAGMDCDDVLHIVQCMLFEAYREAERSRDNTNDPEVLDHAKLVLSCEYDAQFAVQPQRPA